MTPKKRPNFLIVVADDLGFSDTLPEILQDGGYRTLMAGKWHLSMKEELAPAARGFDRSFVLLPGAGNHYGWATNMTDEDRMHCPPFLDGENIYMEDGKTFTEQMLEYLDEWNSSRTAADSQHIPFFALMAYTAPYWPLQAKQETIEHYCGVYDKGPEDLRLRRLDVLIKAGFVAEGVEPYPMKAETPEWHELNEDQKKVEARKMEIYAAMVEEMDMEIGRLVHKLETIDELDNTFVLFMSDNGAEGSLMEAKPASGSSMGRMSKLTKDYFNNSFVNMGKKDSFVVYGPRWALAATAPSRGFKSMTSEGGIRCPCIIRYPGLARASTGGIGHEFMNVMDICPTLLEMSGLQHPNPTFRARDVVSTRGKSWMPYLSGSDNTVYDSELHVTGWELYG